MIVRAAGAALNQIPLDWEHNQQNIVYAMEYARLQGVELLCLPELCITGYGCEDLFLADWVYEKAWSVLEKLLPYTYDITVAIGLPISFQGKHYNAICFIENEVPLGFYAKRHLANDGIHYEKRWFESWNQNNSTFLNLAGTPVLLSGSPISWRGRQIGFEICEDAWISAERPAHEYFKKGIDILLNPSASHFALGKSQLRYDLVQSSSAQFSCAYIYANLLGNEAGRAIYDGEILLANKGSMLASNELCSFQAFNVVWADINLAKEPLLDSVVQSNVTNQDIFLNKEHSFLHAVALALFDYMRKSKSKGFVLSLSGGADSACCAVLVHEMCRLGISELGMKPFLRRIGFSEDLSEQELKSSILTCAYQGTENSSPQTRHAAKNLAQQLQATFYEWNIDAHVEFNKETIESAIGRKLTWEKDDIVLQNIQARVRSPLIWILANLQNALLLTTSNRSEGDVGYATMDGDMSGSIAPIAGIDKKFVKSWLIWAELHLGYTALSHVNVLAPSAELRPLDQHQKDEDDLMPYDLLLAIELCAIRDRMSPVQVFEKLQIQKGKDVQEIVQPSDLKKYIRKFFQLWSRNQWKRERMAPSFHLDDFNVDPKTWCRFPILNSGFREELEALDRM